jgi:hypothetical protein
MKQQPLSTSTAIHGNIRSKRAFDTGKVQARTNPMNADEKHFSLNHSPLSR